MELLTNWVTNIILFVLLAIIIDLLLPNSTIQKYTKMVIGLLLIVIILTPILKIFDSNIEEMLANIKIPTIEEKKEIENLIENKKKEIQASQHAYILEQMAVQMKSVVEEELMSKYGLEVAQVTLQFKEGIEQLRQEDLQIVNVMLKGKDTDDQESIPAIKEVLIDTSTPTTQKKEENLSNVQAFFAEKWQLETERVAVFMEGGEIQKHE